MIKLENVSFKYKNSEHIVLDNLNFSINDGEVLAIVGQNGSGKSTIGRLISGITKLKDGHIFIDDLDISKKSNKGLIRDKIGIVFQNPENQIIFNNIYDELAFSLKGLDKTEIDERVDTALKQVGMFDYKNRDLYSLSLGQKQRIIIAEVLAQHPKYIIFDEPTTMLDGLGKELVYDIIANLRKQGYTIICITNLADEILLADRTLVLKEGKIACEIAKNDLLKNGSLLTQLGIKLPTLLKILIELNNVGIVFDLKNFSVDDFVHCLEERLKWKI